MLECLLKHHQRSIPFSASLSCILDPLSAGPSDVKDQLQHRVPLIVQLSSPLHQIIPFLHLFRLQNPLWRARNQTCKNHRISHTFILGFGTMATLSTTNGNASSAKHRVSMFAPQQLIRHATQCSQLNCGFLGFHGFKPIRSRSTAIEGCLDRD